MGGRWARALDFRSRTSRCTPLPKRGEAIPGITSRPAFERGDPAIETGPARPSTWGHRHRRGGYAPRHAGRQPSPSRAQRARAGTSSRKTRAVPGVAEASMPARIPWRWTPRRGRFSTWRGADGRVDHAPLGWVPRAVGADLAGFPGGRRAGGLGAGRTGSGHLLYFACSAAPSGRS